MIYLPDICGTCEGSTRALNKVYEIYEREEKKDNPKRICIYKEILHNDAVIEEFKKMGIETINDLSEVNSDDILIIRAHGESKSTYDYLKENNIEYVDATCIKVQKIHEKILEKYNAGYEIVIVGDSLHPEVIGSNGWCDNKGFIIGNQVDVVDLKCKNDKIFVTCQTTIDPTIFTEIVQLIKNKFGQDKIEVYNACCHAVKNIMESSIELAKKMDLMFVIGGRDSSNTEVIRQNVSEYVETYKFSDIKVLSDFILRNDIDENKKIGLTGGASTPIKEIYNYKYIIEFLLFYKKVYQQLKSGQKNINDSLSCVSNHDAVLNLINDFKDLNQDGKYIRGILIALGYFLSSKQNDLEYLNLAYAYEMFQTAILIHDDIIDNAKIRREKETIPRRVCRKYLDLSNDATYHEDVLKLANSLGICAGDYGFFEANKLIVKNYATNPHLADILIEYNDIVTKTIEGEIIDVALPFYGKYDIVKPTEQDVLNIYHLKTSFYTIIGPFALGYLLGGKKIDEKLQNVLDKIGISFQIKDDILGIFGDKKKTGKSNTSDISEFKQTILYTYIINTPYKEEFLKIYGNKIINDKDLNKVRHLLKISGSYDYAISYLEELYSNTLLEIDDLDLEEDGKDLLKGLLIYLHNRKK